MVVALKDGNFIQNVNRIESLGDNVAIIYFGKHNEIMVGNFDIKRIFEEVRYED